MPLQATSFELEIPRHLLNADLPPIRQADCRAKVTVELDSVPGPKAGQWIGLATIEVGAETQTMATAALIKTLRNLLAELEK